MKKLKGFSGNRVFVQGLSDVSPELASTMKENGIELPKFLRIHRFQSSNVSYESCLTCKPPSILYILR